MPNYTTYLLKTSTGEYVTNGMLPEAANWTPESRAEIFTAHHPRHVARIITESPEVDIDDIEVRTDHVDLNIGPYSCGCKHCAFHNAQQQYDEMLAETGASAFYGGAREPGDAMIIARDMVGPPPRAADFDIDEATAKVEAEITSLTHLSDPADDLPF